MELYEMITAVFSCPYLVCNNYQVDEIFYAGINTRTPIHGFTTIF